MMLLVALALGTGVAIASAGVRAHGGGTHGNGGHYVDPRCQQPSHKWKWYCRPSTTTTTRKPPTTTTTRRPPTTTTTKKPPSTTTTTLGPASPPTSTLPPPTGPTTSPTSPAPTPAPADDSGDDDSLVALAPPPQSPPPGFVPELPPFTGVPGFELPGFDDLLGEGPGGVPLAMVLVIALAGIATIGLVLRGTFGRGPSLPVVDDGESLKFR